MADRRNYYADVWWSSGTEQDADGLSWRQCEILAVEPPGGLVRFYYADAIVAQGSAGDALLVLDDALPTRMDYLHACIISPIEE